MLPDTNWVLMQHRTEMVKGKIDKNKISVYNVNLLIFIGAENVFYIIPYNVKTVLRLFGHRLLFPMMVLVQT